MIWIGIIHLLKCIHISSMHSNMFFAKYHKNNLFTMILANGVWVLLSCLKENIINLPLLAVTALFQIRIVGSNSVRLGLVWELILK